MTPDDLDRHLARESDRFIDVLTGADPAARVPSCPDWDAADLLWHLTEVQWFWGEIVEHRLAAPPGEDRKPPRPTAYDDLVAAFRTWSGRLRQALAAAEDPEPVWMWAEDKTVGYIRRRQAHEALIHRLDAELVTDAVTPLDPDLATDGVGEVLDVMFGGCPPWGTFTPSGVQVSVETNDTGLVLPVALGRFTGTDPDSGTAYDEVDISVRAARPDLAPAVVVRGTADDLDAWLWHRRDDTRIAVQGDPGVAQDFLGVLSQGIG